MTMKAWQRQYIQWETDKTDALFEKTLHILEDAFRVEIGNYGIEHKKVLYLMSKNLINDAYLKIPAFSEVNNLRDSIRDFANSVVEKLPLENAVMDDSGEKRLNPGVMKIEEELRNVVEGLTINDYFFEKD